MRALFKKSLLLGVCATAGSLVAGLAAPTPASAQFFSPCMLLGSPMPPPCITFDYKRLADMATKQAQEAQKVAAKVQEVKGWANGQAIVGKIKQAVGVQNLAGSQIFNGLPQSFPGVTSTTGFLAAKSSTVNLFADEGAGVNQMGVVAQTRQQYARSASVDGMALAYRKGDMLAATMGDADRIAKAAAASTDLRTDWAVNSEAKRAVAQARATQNFLWQAYLQVHSTRDIASLPVAIGKTGLLPSASTGAAALVPDSGDWDRLQRLIALNNEAQNLLSRLGAVKSADSVSGIIDQVKADYVDAVNRQANLQAQFPVNARRWACNAGQCRNSAIITQRSNQALASWDSQMQSLRNRQIGQLGREFQTRQIDVKAMTDAQIDPRQFIGTWGDPSKYDMITAIANNLTSKTLDKYIDGKGDNAEFQQFLYNYNDVRLEVAWKKEAYDQALASEKELAATKASIAADASTNLNETDVTARLTAIANEGNTIGSQLAQSKDASIVASARDRLNELNNTLAQGVKLPEVASFNPQSCDDAAAYVATQTDSKGRPLQMTAEEMAACKQAAVQGSPYYVQR